MGTRIRTYFLFMLGNWKTHNVNPKLLENIKEVMETIIVGDEFSFITGDNVIVMSLKSHMSFEEIDGILHEFLKPDVAAFFLMPKPRKLSYRLDHNLERHLFGTKSIIKKPNYIDPTLAAELTKQLKSIVDFKMSQIRKRMNINQEKNVIKPLTLDELLDKINEKGMKSLTEKEINFLNNYKS